MKSLLYFLIFQMLIGIWMFIQPLAMGFAITRVSFIDMVLGAVVAIVGLGAFLHETSFLEGTGELHFHCP